MGDVLRLRRPRQQTTRDVVQAALDDGCPSPLAVMLSNLAHWHRMALDLEASADPENAILARVCRMQSQKVASDCAQYCHPRLAATVATVEVEHHHHSPLASFPDRFSKLSDEECARLLSRVQAGDLTIDTVLNGENADELVG